MKGKDCALSRDRNLAKIKLLCNESGHRDVRLDEKKQTHRRLVNIFSFPYNVFSYPKLKRILSKKKMILIIIKKIKVDNFGNLKKKSFDNFGDFHWIGPLKSFNLHRFYRGALGSRGGKGHAPNAPPLGYAPDRKLCSRNVQNLLN